MEFKTKPKAVTTGFSAPPIYMARLQAMADHFGVTKSDVIKHMINEQYTRLVKERKLTESIEESSK